MLSTGFYFIWRSSFRGKDLLEVDQSKTRIAYGAWPCLSTDRGEMSNPYRGTPIDASNQVSVHLANRGFRGEYFLEINQSETRIVCGSHVC